MIAASTWALLSADSDALRTLLPDDAPLQDTESAAAQAFAHILDCDFAGAYDLAKRAPRHLATDAVGRLAAEIAGRVSNLPSLETLAGTIAGLESEEFHRQSWPVCVVAETAMAVGTLSMAESVSRRVWTTCGADDPRTVFAGQTLTRALLFQGRLEEAHSIGDDVEARSRSFGLTALTIVMNGTLAYICALRDDQIGLDRRIDAVESRYEGVSRSYFSGGALVLAAYALAAAGRTRRAAAMMLRAGGGPDLDRLQSVDRVYGYELLVTAALGDGDTVSARSWGVRATEVCAETDGMAAAAQRRISARLAAAAGDPVLGAALADEAAQIAAGQTGHLDATRAQLIAGSALLHDIASSSVAQQTLQIAGGRASDMGAVALAVLARRDLRSIGLRWTGTTPSPMTKRERQVADLVIAGMTDGRISRVLGISERTVQLHVAKVLRALGVHSRTGVVAALIDPASGVAASRELLTPRQQQVADLVARGYPNDGAAAALQVSVKTIEKHVSDIFRRLSIDSRASLAAVWPRS
ncbi:MAG: LuxR C-terminal-related transcriptional regulator [Jatrophihabitans sp.]